MHVVPFMRAPAYDAPGHSGMRMQRLQGVEAGPSDAIWIGCSLIEPGGGTTSGASEVEKFYVCLEGEVQVTAQADGPAQVATLRPLDSCRIAPGETRQLLNVSAKPARLLLVMSRKL
ncbi:MAG: cupin domain-containing protein [Burkholderiaceae bacterium]|jgi:glyoxylate utilization-related uncharacterized protein|nr:cupin domain-containing protein [Burkholderiaceae bacterium]